MEINYILLLCIAVVAFLYASVGHGGASGYLAVMAMFAVPPSQMKSSALILNLFVSLLSFGGYFNHKLLKTNKLAPLLLASIPMAYLGAQLPLSSKAYRFTLAAVLLVGIWRLLFNNTGSNHVVVNPKAIYYAILGATIGLLSGMLGIGGGIVLSPVLLLLGWASLKETAMLSAIFIFANSLSGLIGLLATGYTPNLHIGPWVLAAILGGALGGYAGGNKYNLTTLKRVLAVVLLLSCIKLLI
jgi:uncharacterized protein